MKTFEQKRREYLKEFPDRPSAFKGRSTGLALNLISKAYNRPNTPFIILDHAMAISADVALSKMILSLANKMELSGFEVKKMGKNIYLTYKKLTAI